MSINSICLYSRLLVAVSASAFLGACASNQSSPTSDSGQEVTYTASADEAAQVASDKPLPPGPIVMYMNGLSCPLCATNIDKQVETLPGVSDVKVDLSTGMVRANLAGPSTPSARQLAKAADNAGVTLVKFTR